MIATDIRGNAIGEVTNATARQFMFFLRDTCTASFQMDALDPQAQMIDELSTDLMLWRDSTLMYRGRFGASQDTLGSPGGGSAVSGDPDTHTVQLSAVDYRGMLGYRIFPADTTYTNVDQGQIAWQMINSSETRLAGAFGITQGRVPTSIQRTITQTAGSIVEESINDLALLDNGFDWEISPTLQFNTWPIPSQGSLNQLGRGQNIGMTLNYGDNVMAAQRSLDATLYANLIRYTGGTPSGATTPLVSNVDIVTNLLYEANFNIRGRWEGIDSNTNILNQAALNAAALGDLVRRAAAIPSYTLTLTPNWWDPIQLWLGDIVSVIVNHGRLAENFVGRVSEIDIYIGDDANDETVVVTIGPRIGSLLRRLLSEHKKLEQIAKNV